MLLSALGVRGIVANLASERTREMGVRTALGARSRDVAWLFMPSGVRRSLLGPGIGLLRSTGRLSQDILQTAFHLSPEHTESPQKAP